VAYSGALSSSNLLYSYVLCPLKFLLAARFIGNSLSCSKIRRTTWHQATKEESKTEQEVAHLNCILARSELRHL
jgi:hypothetical protein